MNTRRLTGEAAVYTLGNVLDSLAPFLVLPIMGRYLTPAQFGIADVITSTAGLAYFAVGLNLDQALTRYYYDENEIDRRQLATTHAILTAGTGLIFVAIGWMLLSLVQGSLPYPTAWFWALLSVPLLALSDHAATLFRLQHQPLRQLTLLGIRSFVWAAATASFLVIWQMGISSIFIGRIAGAIFGILASIYALRALYASRGRRSFAARSLRFSIPTLPAVLAGWGLIHAARYFLVIGASAEETGYYGVGVRLTYIVATIGIGVVMAWGPFFMGIKDRPNARDIQAKGLLFFIAVNVVCIVPIVIFAKETVWALMGSQYLPAIAFVGPMLTATLFSNLALFLFVQISVSERTHWQSIGYAVGLGVMILANIVLLPHLKGLGAAIAMLCGQLATAGTMFIAAQRLYAVPFSYKRAAVLLLVLASAIPLAGVATKWLGTSIHGFALRAGIVATLWLVCVGAVGIGNLTRFVRLMAGDKQGLRI